jgi:tRNA-specific 2-thiouridylase
MNRKTVVVGMSGGVDSSVTALLLKEQGYHVIGLFMKNWEEKNGEGVCQSAQDFEDVAKVCDQLKIPYYSVNFVQEYWDNVFIHFLSDLKAGFTPNPDILCNKEIKFKVFLEKAMSLGADYLATGHYCQIGEQHALIKGRDPQKDQSYFLYTLQSKTLEKVLFPIGHLTKQEVRRLAAQHQLATSAKKDSTGICFIGKRDFRPFLSQYIGYTTGNFENLQGKVVGQHQGVAFYTLGQRKGLAIGGKGDAWFVVSKDIERNVVVVAQGSDHPALYRSSLVATELSWVLREPPLPHRCTAKVRYRQADQECVIEKIEGGEAFVSFSTPQRAITPRQSIVFYEGERCLGGGMIIPKKPEESAFGLA